MTENPLARALADLARTATIYHGCVEIPEAMEGHTREGASMALVVAIERAERILDGRLEGEAPVTLRRRPRPRGPRRR